MNAFGYVLFHLTSTRLVDYNTENVSRFQVGFFSVLITQSSGKGDNHKTQLFQKHALHIYIT